MERSLLHQTHFLMRIYFCSLFYFATVQRNVLFPEFWTMLYPHEAIYLPLLAQGEEQDRMSAWVRMGRFVMDQRSKWAGSQWCRAQEQLGLLGAEAGDLWSLFCGSPGQGWFVIQVVFPSTSERGTAELDGSRLNSQARRKYLAACESCPWGCYRLATVLRVKGTKPPSGFSASPGLHSPIQLRVPQKPCAMAWMVRYRKGHTEAEALMLALFKWGTACSLIRSIIFFMVHNDLPCFPYKKCLQLLPNSLASSPSLKVHSRLQPQSQLTNSLPGVNKALHFRSARKVSWCPCDSPLEGSSRNTPPWWCDLGTVQRVPG